MRIFTSLICTLILLAVSAPAMAQESKIGVVDVRYILNQSMAAQSIQKQRSELQNKFASEISDKEKKLRDEEQALMKEREKMSADDFLKKKQEYERKLLETGRDVRERKQALEVVLGEAMTQLQDKLTDIVGVIAKERGLELVISKQSVLIGAENLDMTKEAMEKLNKDMPTVKLGAPKA